MELIILPELGNSEGNLTVLFNMFHNICQFKITTVLLFIWVVLQMILPKAGPKEGPKTSSQVKDGDEDDREEWLL